MDWSSRESSSDGAERPLRLFGLGHSHLTGLQHADAARGAAKGPDRTIFRFAPMLEPRFKPNLMGEGEEVMLHPSLLAMLESEVASGAAPPIVAAISGNEHHFLGMVNHPRRFDFVLREKPHLPLWPGAEIVPAGLLAAALGKLMAGPKAQLSALRRATSLPIVYVGSPPPVPDDDYVARQETVFAEPIARLGVAPASLRWKLWRLQTRLYEQACTERGIQFLPPPPDAVDEHGFLREQAWHADCVHANHWYGERVLRQVEARAAALRQAGTARPAA